MDNENQNLIREELEAQIMSFFSFENPKIHAFCVKELEYLEMYRTNAIPPVLNINAHSYSDSEEISNVLEARYGPRDKIAGALTIDGTDYTPKEVIDSVKTGNSENEIKNSFLGKYVLGELNKYVLAKLKLLPSERTPFGGAIDAMVDEVLQNGGSLNSFDPTVATPGGHGVPYSTIIPLLAPILIEFQLPAAVAKLYGCKENKDISTKELS